MAQSITINEDAFRQFLPATMVATVREPDEGDVAIDFAIWRFIPYSSDCRSFAEIEELFLKFSAGQRKLILEWISYYFQSYDPVEGAEEQEFRRQFSLLEQADRRAISSGGDVGR